VASAQTAGNDWLRHSDARLGAALAYYSVFSLGPVPADRCEHRRAVIRRRRSQFRALLGPLGSQAVETLLKGAGSQASGTLTAAIEIIHWLRRSASWLSSRMR
jgi:membrane protein